MHDPICKKFIRTENLCNLLNIISLLLSFALFIRGIKTCLEKRKPIIKNINIIIFILFSSTMDDIRPNVPRTRPKR